ncbi:MAG: hypothetical protein AAF993_12350 [Pseudomonadota bacterium]
MSDKLPPNFDWQSITPEDSPKTPMDVLADPTHQALATADVQEGDAAYGFRSQIYDFSDGTEVATGETRGADFWFVYVTAVPGSVRTPA